MHTLTLAFFAAIQRTPRARVIWPSDDEIAARVMTAAVRGAECSGNSDHKLLGHHDLSYRERKRWTERDRGKQRNPAGAWAELSNAP